jgi:hypothetical protein
MDLTHGKTGRTIPIRVDNVVSQPGGCLLVEAMFSTLADLSSPSVDLAARLHPTKAEAFEWIVSGQCSVASEGKPIPVVPDVQLHVNRPQPSDRPSDHTPLSHAGGARLSGCRPGAWPVPPPAMSARQPALL